MNTIPPRGDRPLDAWLRNFVGVLSTAPESFGVDAAAVGALEALAEQYHAALRLATDPATRTIGAIAGKTASRKLALSATRQAMRRVNAYAPLTPSQRADLGLRARDASPSRIGRPQTFPVLSVVRLSTLSVTLRLHDVATPTRRAKPADTIGCELWVKIGGPPPASLDDCRYWRLVTRDQVTLTFPAGTGHQTAYVIGRWVNARGEPGALGACVTAMVVAPAGTAMRAAA
ncbi:MAG TPA: hypothetical protein VEA69_03240 [Tepidisphaeraceae bacterium]|nr:hypothetical protein [Tepidisphaeraceae bacterium]